MGDSQHGRRGDAYIGTLVNVELDTLGRFTIKKAMPDMMLTPRQAQVLKFIRERVAQGEPPTIREIGDALGIGSTNGVVSHIRALQHKGLLTDARGKSRSLRPTDMGVDPLKHQRDQIKAVMEALGVPLVGDGLPDDWAQRCIAAARMRRR